MYFPKLEYLRVDNDLKQENIADYLQIKQTVYSRYETGRQTIPVRHLVKLADYYETSTDYILGRTDDDKPYPPRQRLT